MSKTVGGFILCLMRGKIVNYPRKEHKMGGFSSLQPTTVNEGEREENFNFSPKIIEKPRENQGIRGGIKRNTYIHL
jgi:hypothetical protein